MFFLSFINASVFGLSSKFKKCNWVFLCGLESFLTTEISKAIEQANNIGQHILNRIEKFIPSESTIKTNIIEISQKRTNKTATSKVGATLKAQKAQSFKNMLRSF